MLFATVAKILQSHVPLWIVPVDLMRCLEYTELMATVL